MHVYMHDMDAYAGINVDGNREWEMYGMCRRGIFLSIPSHQLPGGYHTLGMPVVLSLRTCTRSAASISIFIHLDLHLDRDLILDLDLVFH